MYGNKFIGYYWRGGLFSQELANRPYNFYIGQSRKSLRAKYTCKTSCPSYIRENKEITHNKTFLKKKKTSKDE